MLQAKYRAVNPFEFDTCLVCSGDEALPIELQVWQVTSAGLTLIDKESFATAEEARFEEAYFWEDERMCRFFPQGRNETDFTPPRRRENRCSSPKLCKYTVGSMCTYKGRENSWNAEPMENFIDDVKAEKKHPFSFMDDVRFGY